MRSSDLKDTRQVHQNLQALGEKLGVKFSAIAYVGGKKIEIDDFADAMTNTMLLREAKKAGMKDPTIYACLIGREDGGRPLAKLLNEKTNLVEGEDYLRHHGGMRGGSIYFELVHEHALARFEAALSSLDRGVNLSNDDQADKPKRPWASFTAQTLLRG